MTLSTTVCPLFSEGIGTDGRLLDPLDGYGHFDYAYDVVVVALEGAQRMEVVLVVPAIS